MNLSKTDFVHFIKCPKSFWLLKNRPDQYPHGEFSDFMKKITSEGYEVEAHVQALLRSQPDADQFSFQTKFEPASGLYARGDVIRENENGTINIYEVKSSTSVKRSPQQNQIKDITFQKIAAEDAGWKVDKSFIIHLNNTYVRCEGSKPVELRIVEDISGEIASIEAQTRVEIDTALKMLVQPVIDESSCDCIELTKSNHCDAFDYFNPNIPKLSIYNLPRISRAKLRTFIADGRIDLDDIALHEVTEKQAHVLRSAHLKEPVVDTTIISDWFSRLEYPVYFLDYETYASATPIVDGARPHSPIPFQYSLHIKKSKDEASLDHVEYLTDRAEMPINMIEHLEKHIGDVGSVVSWHASFENTQNRSMMAIYPDKQGFLQRLMNRTVDLEDLFKEGYVDINFQGSTSIKKVLPVLVPELDYAGMKVANGTDAMEAWQRLTRLPTGQAKDKLRKSMLEYCKLDTLAMVRIFEFLEKI